MLEAKIFQFSCFRGHCDAKPQAGTPAVPAVRSNGATKGRRVQVPNYLF